MRELPVACDIFLVAIEHPVSLAGSAAMASQRPDALAYAIGSSERWGDGAGLSGLDATLQSTQRLEALTEWLRSRHESGRPCAWLRPPARAADAPGGVLLSVNPGRPIAGLHGDRAATMNLHEAAVWFGGSGGREGGGHDGGWRRKPGW